MNDINDQKDLDAERDWMMERWHEGGKEFGVFLRTDLNALDRGRKRVGPHFLRCLKGRAQLPEGWRKVP
jgi:hypothetical protein